MVRVGRRHGHALAKTRGVDDCNVMLEHGDDDVDHTDRVQMLLVDGINFDKFAAKSANCSGKFDSVAGT